MSPAPAKGGTDRLKDLGLTVRETSYGVEAELELGGALLINPLNKAKLESVTFTVVGERLIAIDPPELVGLPPLLASSIATNAQLTEQVVSGFNEHLGHLQRRSSELQALHLAPKVDPTTLQLSVEVGAGDFAFTLLSDRRGNFRVARAAKKGELLDTSEGQSFELSEFRERGALASYLLALFGEVPATPPATQPTPPPPVRYAELAAKIGVEAMVPPTSPIELLVELKVNKQLYRFAAARVTGRTFRGLLAGQAGNKLWAERFELDAFPGVRALVRKVLGVKDSEIEISPVEGGDRG